MKSGGSHVQRNAVGTSGALFDGLQPVRVEFDRRAIAIGCAVAVAYYAGAKIGLLLTFPPNPISILWPPNSILLAGLLLVPVRTWWILIAATMPAHLLAELQGGVPLSMVLCWFVSNVTQALIGAALMRRFVSDRLRLDSVRAIFAFLAFVAFLAPFLSSFIDAAFVTLVGWGERGYRELWTNRFFSNVLAALTIVPVIVTAATYWRAPRAPVRPAQMLEATALFAGLLAVCFFVFDSRPAGSSPAALLYLPLPFLLWASLRFGMLGMAMAFAVISSLVIWGGAHQRGPLVLGESDEHVLMAQLFLISIAVPFYTLTSVFTERRESEQRCRESDERFRLVLQATKDIVYDWQLRKQTLWLNNSGIALFGDPSRQTAGHPAMWSGLLHPDDGPSIVAGLKTVIGQGGRQWNAEYRIRTADGSYAYYRERAFVVLDESKVPQRMIGSLMDVTDSKRAAEANERLAHASRLAVVGELTASVAHELNQPLGAILSNVDAADMLLKRTPPMLDEVGQILDDIRKDDLRAAEIIRHIRTLLRKRAMTMEPFDLNRAIADVLDLASADLARRGVAVHTSFAPLGPVYGDQVHIQQVVLNLVLNGADAMAGISSRHLLEIRTAREDSGDVEVSVSDSGPGIDPDHAQLLFESFFTTKENGMGLGLSIARTIIESHKGRLWAEARAEGGTSFRFTIPIAASRSGRAERVHI